MTNEESRQQLLGTTGILSYAINDFEIEIYFVVTFSTEVMVRLAL